ncbi:MAG: DUF928 domain-containing protein [Leptolyngbyaceae cyanobacterium]
MKQEKLRRRFFTQSSITLCLILFTNAIYQSALQATEGGSLHHVPIKLFQIIADDSFDGTGKPDDLSAGDANAVDFSGEEREGDRFAGERRTGDEICPDIGDGQPLTALIPATNYGETTRRRPTLWFYVPYTSEQIIRGRFSLQDTDGQNVALPISFSLPAGGPGLVSFTFPEAFALENVGTDYLWFFQLYCGSEDTPDKSVDGQIQRVAISSELEEQLNQASVPEDVAFANQRIWFDAVDSLANLRLEAGESSELDARWNRLMTAPGVPLEDTPEVPLIDSQIPLIGNVILNLPEPATQLEPIAD